MSSCGMAYFKRGKMLLCIVFSDLLKRNANQIGSRCILSACHSVSMTPRKMFRRPLAGGAIMEMFIPCAYVAAVKSPSFFWKKAKNTKKVKIHKMKEGRKEEGRK